MVKLNSRPALVVVDMQNGFCHRQGCMGKLDLNLESMRAIVPAINHLRKTFRSLDLPIFMTQMAFSPDYSDSGLILEDLQPLKDMGALQRHSWDAAFLDDLKPQEGDIVIEKTRNNAFLFTDFELRLIEHGVNHLVVVGCATNICVESAVRGAHETGRRVCTVSDATVAMSEEEQRVTLKTLGWFGGTATVDEIEDALRKL